MYKMIHTKNNKSSCTCKKEREEYGKETDGGRGIGGRLFNNLHTKTWRNVKQSLGKIYEHPLPLLVQSLHCHESGLQNLSVDVVGTIECCGHTNGKNGGLQNPEVWDINWNPPEQDIGVYPLNDVKASQNCPIS